MMGASIFTVLVGLLWVGTMPMRLASINNSPAEETNTEQTSAFTHLMDTFKGGMANVVGAVDSDEVSTEDASVDPEVVDENKLDLEAAIQNGSKIESEKRQKQGEFKYEYNKSEEVPVEPTTVLIEAAPSASDQTETEL